ncbi:hypothetical protein HKCCE3408_16730 [Rhodobacterales bacterium HKCCE3408]|nr:hypothetical protein [Rhodobacterales bacterium HKCCE3408]
MILRGAIGGTLLALVAGAAAADHFTSIDLGRVSDRDTCMAQARTVFEIYGRSYGAEVFVSSGSWTVSGWDLPPIGADVNVMCVEVGGVWNAFATGHVSGDGETPEATVEQLRDMFQK